ncbi:winged helix DNA-binding domain-containing protein [Georgenia subflava]|nr:winged helix DNA-binding domain-containing protein [Georgenia subflava]
MTRAAVLRRRLAVQRLSGAGLRRPSDVVRLLTCVQAQEHPHALWSLGMRTRDADFALLAAAFDAGDFLRTHILRPTWHFVAPEDLRWIVDVTSPRVLDRMRGHLARQGLEDDVIRRGAEVLHRILAGRTALTRKEIGRHMAAAGLPAAGLPLGDLLLTNELRGVIVSGPMRGAAHTHVLTDEVVAPSPALDRDEALGRLAHRFYAGHGPASVKDLTRWASLTQADARRGIDVAGGALERVEVDGVPHWFDPAVPSRTGAGSPTAVLLPTYDEVVLTYPALGFPVLDGHPHGPRADPAVDPYAGTVLVDGVNAGSWKRRTARETVEIELRLAAGVTPGQTAAVEMAADRLAGFLGLARTVPA